MQVVAVAHSLQLDMYGCIQLINFIRSNGQTPSETTQLVASASEQPWPWASEQFFRPVLEDDPLLYSLPSMVLAKSAAGTSEGANADDDDEEAADAAAAAHAMAATAELGELDAISMMRSQMAAVIGSEDGAPATGEHSGVLSGSVTTAAEAAAAAAAAVVAAAAQAAAAFGASATVQAAVQAAVQAPTQAQVPAGSKPSGAAAGSLGAASALDAEAAARVDQSYYESYARLSIHEEMLSDRVRTEGYRDAIERNAHMLKGKVVLDVGCGTGILSMFAARAGAALVIGVDASDIIEHARKVVAHNGLSEKVILVRTEVEKLTLPNGLTQVDVIISEWMGYLLLYESMLPSVLYARDRWLRPGGTMMPSTTTLHISACAHDRIAFWKNDVYGFSYLPIAEHAARADCTNASVEVVPPASLISDASLVKSFCSGTISPSELDFNAEFVLTITGKGPLRCLVTHFDTLFEVEGGVTTSFTTACTDTPTHWKQVALHLREAVDVDAGDELRGKISLVRNSGDTRGYDVSLSFQVNGVGAVRHQLFRMH